jgi:D-alanine-D-alanine ligase
MSSSPSGILVLHETLGADARADEIDALLQVEQVSATLRQLGWPVDILSTGLELETTLAAVRKLAPACVFNLVESLQGNGRLIHFVPALLSVSGIPFTGCDSDAIYLSSHKLLAKKFMRQHGIATPTFFSPADTPATAPGEWIVKSVWEHASFGMDDGCVVATIEAAKLRMAESEARHGGDWFAEQFVDGREFNVSVIEVDGLAKILPLAEMLFIDYPRGKPKIVGYAAKWDESAAEYHATQRVFPQLPQAEHDAIETLVQDCWNLFGLRGYARVDIRMDAEGKPWVLEVNANPCLSTDAGLVAAASEAGIAYPELIQHLLQAGIN